MNIAAAVVLGVRKSLRGVRYKVFFLTLFAAVFALFVYIPALSVAGNSFALQLTLFSPLDYAVIVGISILYALFLTMQAYVVFSQKKSAGNRAVSVGSTAGSGVGALFAGVAGTAFCASCLAPLFAFFGIGFGGLLFVLEYRFYFVAAIVALMLAAMYLTSKRILQTCGE